MIVFNNLIYSLVLYYLKQNLTSQKSIIASVKVPGIYIPQSAHAFLT